MCGVVVPEDKKTGSVSYYQTIVSYSILISCQTMKGLSQNPN